VGTPNETVVYLDYDGCYRKTLDGDQPAKRIIANTGKFDGLAASPEHDVVALFGRQGLNLWSITDGSLLGTVDIEAGVTAAEWSPNGQQLLLLLSHGELQIRDGRSLELVQSQSTDLNGSGHVAWAHSGQYVAAHDDFGRIVTWDLAAKHVESHSADQATLPTFVFAPRGEFLILPDASHDVWVLPTKGQDRQRRYLGTADSLVSALCLFNDGQSLLVGTAEGTLECWSTITGLPLWNRDKGMPLPDDPMDPMSPMDRTSPFAESEGACVSSAA
jgi:WD40 repeat protein